MRDWQKDWELSQAAQPGPWIYKDGTIRNTYGAMVLGTYQDFDTEVGEWIPKLDYSDKDMNFILESREALPYWLQRVKELEAENKKLRLACDDMREELVALHSQIGATEAQVKELEAQAAAIREALEPFAKLEHFYQRIDQIDQHHLFTVTLTLGQHRDALNKVIKALSSDAGRDLLEKVKKLEAVAKAAQAFVDEWDSDDDIGMLDLYTLDELREALAALEGGDQG